MILRPYQQDLFERTQAAFSHHKAVCVQLCTGAGKTPIIAKICESALLKKNNVWVVVPRLELINQTSKHLKSLNVAHGMICQGMVESRLYNVHVVSKDTLTRRYSQIKRHPNLIIVDECHLALDRQIGISKQFPDSRILGFTATPERLDGRGLSELYGTLVEGLSIPELTRGDYLSKLRYFSPPLEGLDKIKRQGTDYNAEDLDAFLNRKKIYGRCIDHYERHAKYKPALVFCRNVQSAYDIAAKFRQRGYEFYCIEGNMEHGERRRLIKALGDGEIHGLTNCEIATYGLDIPSVQVGICLRPTLSRSLYFQMVGRLLRIYKDKDFAMFFDHVHNLHEHADERHPDIPPHYLENIEWNFNGDDKRKRKGKDENELSLKLCPDCFLYFDGLVCPNCGSKHKPATQKTAIEVIDKELVEHTPIPLKNLPPQEKREFIDKINNAIELYETSACQAVTDMIKLQEKFGYSVLWIYWKLNKENRQSVNISLLSEIARQKKYKKGWVFHQRRKLKDEI